MKLPNNTGFRFSRFEKQLGKKSGVLNLWIVSYLIILVIPLLLSSIIFSTASRLVETNTDTISTLTLDQTRLSVNRIFSDISTISRQLLNQKETLSLSYARTPLSIFKRESIGNLQLKIQEQTAYSSYIRDTYIYFGSLRLTSSSKGMLSESWFLRQLSLDHGISQEEFQGFHTLGEKYRLRLLSDSSGSITGVAHIATGASGSNVVCITILGPEVFRDLLSTDTENLHIWLTDSTAGTYLCQEATRDIAAAHIQNPAPAVKGSLTTSEETYRVTETGTDIRGWDIISAMPTRQYTWQIKNVQIIYLVFLLACVFLGLAVSIYFAYRNYRPVKKLSQLVGSQNYKRDKQDEFTYLENSLSHLIQTKESYEKELSSHKLALRYMNLRRMLRGTIHTRQGFETACTDYHICFSSETFFIIAIKVLDYAALNEKDSEAELNQPIFSVVSAALGSLLLEQCDTYFCADDEILYAISAFRQAPQDQTLAISTLTEICEKESRSLQRREGLELTFYISKLYSDTNNPGNSIHAAYKECLWAFEQSEALSLTAPAINSEMLHKHFESISGVQPGPLSKAAQRRLLAQYIFKGKTNEALQLLPQVMNNGIAHLNPDFSYLRMHCIFLADYIFSSAEDCPGTVEVRHLKTLLDAIQNAQTVGELNRLMEEAVRSLSTAFSQKSCPDSGNGLYLEILSYIDSHFQDPNLSVTVLAEHFGMSQSYLLRVFKKDFGSGLLDYIHQRRVDQSKALLKGSSKTIAEIACAIGYSNQLALIRAFKRLEGITPSEYRSLS